MSDLQSNQQKTIVQTETKKKTPKLGGLIFLFLLFAMLGIGFLGYPYGSDLWNRYRNQVLLADYTHQVQGLSGEQYVDLWRKALEYNRHHRVNTFEDSFSREDYEPEDPYDSYLNPAGDGIMGSIEIPRIKVHLPIYHGVSRDILEHGAGHSEGTSLPIGGKGTHSIISAHRALPQAKLFTDLDQMKINDFFFLHILDKVFVYRVNQIKTVLPHETEDVMIVEGKDYCTLLTCTPYAVNTHRLLVRGERLLRDDLSKMTADQLGLTETDYQKVLLDANFGYDGQNDLGSNHTKASDANAWNNAFRFQKDVLVFAWLIEHWRILLVSLLLLVFTVILLRTLFRKK